MKTQLTITKPNSQPDKNGLLRPAHLLPKVSASTPTHSATAQSNRDHSGVMHLRNLLRMLALLLASILVLDSSAMADPEHDPILGKWRQDNASIIEVHSDGKCTNWAPGHPTYDGKWRKVSGEEYIIVWTEGLYTDKVIIRARNQLWRKNDMMRWDHFANRL